MEGAADATPSTAELGQRREEGENDRVERRGLLEARQMTCARISCSFVERGSEPSEPVGERVEVGMVRLTDQDERPDVDLGEVRDEIPL